MKIKALVASSLIAASTLFGGTYAVDPAHSSADFSATAASVVFWALPKGRNKKLKEQIL
jgi:polyisoprenoid-binding protein YceI